MLVKDQWLFRRFKWLAFYSQLCCQCYLRTVSVLTGYTILQAGLVNKILNCLVSACSLDQVTNPIVCPIQAPGRNAPLIQFLISALYIQYIVCLFISYASPLILFFLSSSWAICKSAPHSRQIPRQHPSNRFSFEACQKWTILNIFGNTNFLMKFDISNFDFDNLTCTSVPWKLQSHFWVTAWVFNILSQTLDLHVYMSSEWQINGESTSMVWPTLGSRTAKEQNRTCILLLLKKILAFLQIHEWSGICWKHNETAKSPSQLHQIFVET